MPCSHLNPIWRFQGVAFALLFLLAETRESASSTVVRPHFPLRSWKLPQPLRGGTMTQCAENETENCCAFTSLMEQEQRMQAVFRRLDGTSLSFFRPPDGDGMERLESYETALGDAQSAVSLYRVRLRKWGKHLQKSFGDEARQVTQSLDTMRFLYSTKIRAVEELYECSRLSFHRAWVSGTDFDLFSSEHKQNVDRLNEELDTVEEKLEENQVAIYRALYAEDSELRRSPSILWGESSKNCYARCFCQTGYPQNDNGDVEDPSARQPMATDQHAAGADSFHAESNPASGRAAQPEDEPSMNVAGPPEDSDDESVPAEDDRSYYAKADAFAERYKDFADDDDANDAPVPVGDMCMMMEALRRKAADLKALEGGEEADEIAARVDQLHQMMMDEAAQQQQAEQDSDA